MVECSVIIFIQVLGIILKLNAEEAEAYLDYAESNLPAFFDVCVISRNKSEEKRNRCRKTL